MEDETDNQQRKTSFGFGLKSSSVVREAFMESYCLLRSLGWCLYVLCRSLYFCSNNARNAK